MQDDVGCCGITRRAARVVQDEGGCGITGRVARVVEDEVGCDITGRGGTRSARRGGVWHHGKRSLYRV